MPLNWLIDSGQQIDPRPDVQRTTLGVDALSRFVCNTWEEATAGGSRPFDAVVIGAGMFGGYCADQIYRLGAADRLGSIAKSLHRERRASQGLSEGLKVLVLDAGPFLIPTHVQNLPGNIGLEVPTAISPAASEAGAARDSVWGISWRSNVEFIGQPYCIGGKSLYWGGWCPRLPEVDLKPWPSTVRKYLTDNYLCLEKKTGVVSEDQGNLEVKTEFIQGALFDLLKQRVSTFTKKIAVPKLDPPENPPLAVQGRSPSSGIFAFDKYSSVAVLIEAVRDAASQPDSRRRLFVVPNAHVTCLNAANGVVTSIDVFVDGAKRSLPISPNCSVVLALGTIESTRLALTSFPTSPNNPARELMGRNLMAHCRTNIFARIRRSALDPNNTLPKELETAALLVRGSTRHGRFQIQLTASANLQGNPDAQLFAMIPDIDVLKDMRKNQDAKWISICFRGASQLIGDQATSVPNPSGRWINLSPEKDEFGMRRAYVQLTTTSAEDALADAMDATIERLAKELAGNNPNDLQITRRIRDGLGTTFHEAGTLWMGTDPKTSVTDTNGRFHHITNAYCADQSLFVTVGSVNPTLTGLVLAQKVAEAVVDRHPIPRHLPEVRGHFAIKENGETVRQNERTKKNGETVRHNERTNPMMEPVE
jgi:choline dehydrogenase-like flavoprotein